MRYIPSIRARQRGDTIVEVLLSLAVIGMVLGTSYAIVNRSLAVGRDAQERTEALKLAESQIERLKVLTADFNTGYFALPENTVYCVSPGLDRREFGTFGGSFPETDIGISYHADCQVGPGNRYRVSVERSGNVFTIRVRWDNVVGRTLSEVKMVYSMYGFSYVPPSVTIAYLPRAV